MRPQSIFVVVLMLFLLYSGRVVVVTGWLASDRNTKG